MPAIARLARTMLAAPPPLSGSRRSARCIRAGAGARAKAGNGGELPGPGGLEPPARHSGRVAACAQCGPGPLHLCRPLDLPDREPAARAHRDRLQRLCALAGPARHRHHEPRAYEPLHRSSRSRASSTCCAAGGRRPDQPARHDVTLKDVRVRNVPTNIRDWRGGTERHGNSIFIYEMANMCIAHLGHLHHTLNQQQLDEIGRVDVVFVPVDGNMTLDLEGMIEVLQALKAPLMIPMHYLQHLHAPPLPRARAAELDGGDERNSLARGVEDEPAGHPQSDRAARTLSASGARREKAEPERTQNHDAQRQADAQNDQYRPVQKSRPRLDRRLDLSSCLIHDLLLGRFHCCPITPLRCSEFRPDPMRKTGRASARSCKFKLDHERRTGYRAC